MKAKTYTKRELERAYRLGGETIKGGAEMLGVSWKTFKKHWVRAQEQSSPTPTQSTIDEIVEEPGSDSNFVDPEVEKLVEKYRKEKESFQTSMESVIYEIVDKIDVAKRQKQTLEDQIEKWETYLENVKL